MPARKYPYDKKDTCMFLVAFVSSVISFSLSVRKADFSWREYRASLSTEDWRQEVCDVTSLNYSECDDRGEHELLVKVCVLPNSESDCNAGYRRQTAHPFNRTCIKKDDLDAFVDDNNIFEGQKITCWVGPFDRHVRLDEGGYEKWLRDSLKSSRNFDTVLCVYYVLLYICWFLVRSRSLKRPPPPRNAVYEILLISFAAIPPITPNRPPSTAPLTNSEANAFLRTCELEEPSTEVTCPICREEFGDGQRPIVRFPCNHHYHFEWAHRWLQEFPKCLQCAKDLLANIAQILVVISDPKPQISPDLVLQTDPHSHSTEHRQPNQRPTSSPSSPLLLNSSPTAAPTRIV